MSVKLLKHSRAFTALVPAILVLIVAALAFYKLEFLGYDLNMVEQAASYFIETVMEFDGHGSPVDVTLALPRDLPNQKVSDEAFSSGDLKFDTFFKAGNRFGRWRGEDLTGKRHLGYSATVITRSQKYVIDSLLPTKLPIPVEVGKELLADELTQSDDFEISKLADSLGLSSEKPILTNIRTIYDYVVHGLKYVDYSGTTDALTAYRLGEASCGGKSRLMAALGRHLGIPARLVGGKILRSGKSTATHIWVEYYVDSVWVPFCPTNHYFAEIPSDYLTIYYGEYSLIKRTKDINFKYFFNLRKRIVAAATLVDQSKKQPLSTMDFWTSFKRAAISLELLRIIIMLPVGVLAVVVFRNLIGLETFGTFMPALIAIGFRDTGLFSGLLLFGVILAFGAVVRLAISRMQLLHTPRLAVILSMVVLFILTLAAFGVQSGFLNVARVALFPMVILTLTVERFSLILEESGWWNAVRISVLTMLVAASAYELMSMRFLQSVVISFPETILLIVAIYIYIGRYSGFRMSEYVRFKNLLTRNSQ